MDQITFYVHTPHIHTEVTLNAIFELVKSSA